MKNKEIVCTSFFVFLSIFFYTLFPNENIFQKIFSILAFFVVLPLFFNKIILGRNIDSFGFRRGNYTEGLKFGLISLVINGFILFIYSYFFNFFDRYGVPQFIIENFSNFLLYELVISLSFIFLYEFYFRGFIMFIFESHFKYWSILIQSFFVLLLFLNMDDSYKFSFMPYLIFSPFAGFISYKSKSIIYSGIAQFIIVLSLDVIFMGMIK
jgi:membrane protease YdiL (CAAX protease family)